MKTNRWHRVLSLVAFLLLMAPFYDSCDGDYAFKKVPESNIAIKKTFSEKLYDVVVDEESFNALEIGSITFIGIKNSTFQETKEEFSKAFQKKDWYKDLGLFISFIFDFIILISFSVFILMFTKKMKLLNKLASVNSILIIITLLYIIFLESSFEHFRQIKWGYYAFIITNLLIFYYSRKVLNRQYS